MSSSGDSRSLDEILTDSCLPSRSELKIKLHPIYDSTIDQRTSRKPINYSRNGCPIELSYGAIDSQV